MELTVVTDRYNSHSCSTFTQEEYPRVRHVERNLQPRERGNVVNRLDFLASDRVNLIKLLLSGLGSRLRAPDHRKGQKIHTPASSKQWT